jgi:hypothetical protein
MKRYVIFIACSVTYFIIILNAFHVSIISTHLLSFTFVGIHRRICYISEFIKRLLIRHVNTTFLNFVQYQLPWRNIIFRKVSLFRSSDGKKWRRSSDRSVTSSLLTRCKDWGLFPSNGPSRVFSPRPVLLPEDGKRSNFRSFVFFNNARRRVKSRQSQTLVQRAIFRIC